MLSRRTLTMLLGMLVGTVGPAPAQGTDHPAHQYFQLGTFELESGDTLPDAKLLFVTHGQVSTDRRNAVLVPSWHGGNHHGYDFLIGPGYALDPAKFFIIVGEMFASGGSSSPSNTPPPFDGPRFPPINIRDNVRAMYRLVTEQFGLTHLHAIVGFSMGAQQAFQWAVSYPEFVDRIVPFCGTAKTYPHGIVRLEGAIRVYQADAAFAHGNYRSRPEKGQAASAAHWAAWVFSQEWWRRELYKPRWSSPDALIQEWATDTAAQDPNDEITQSRAWQHNNVGETPGYGGDHERALRSIRARVLYMPCSTDLYFPVEDVKYESRFIPHVKVVPIRSLWGHAAGAGLNPADNAFLNAEISKFLGR